VLVNSGAEAVENAIKIARAYTKRPAVICFEDAFHGRTLMAMTLTSKPNPYKAGFEPLASDVYRIPFAYSYRSGAGTTVDEFAHHLEDAFKRHVAAENVAAVIAEPVLGEGGFVVPPRAILPPCTKSARNTEFYLCRRSAVRYSADGKMVRVRAFRHRAGSSYHAKSLGGGMPLAAVTGRQK